MEALLRIVAASNWHKIGRGIRVAVVGKEREIQHIDVLREVIQGLRCGSALNSRRALVAPQRVVVRKFRNSPLCCALSPQIIRTPRALSTAPCVGSCDVGGEDASQLRCVVVVV